jgi:sporulation protein YlmC with PRC-barrel domain
MGATRSIRVGDLVGSRVITASGTTLGRVAEVRATRQPPHRVTALELGPYGWLDRLHVSALDIIGQRVQPHEIRWDAVERFEHGTIVLKPGRDQGVSRL